MAQEIVSIDGKLVEFSLIMEEHGWITMQFKEEDRTHEIYLSFVFKPLESLAKWIIDIGKRSFPAEVEINQEGCESTLQVSEYENSKEYVFFKDLDKYSKEPDYEKVFFYKEYPLCI